MNPIEQSEHIEKKFREYVKSTFQIEDEEYEKCFEKELNEAVLCKGPFISSEFPFDKGESIRELVNQGKISTEFLRLSKINFDQKLYYHQQKSLGVIGKGHNAVITTGTGSGKTESFLYPVLNHILREIENGEGGKGIRALFLYPMNALVNDQMERIRKILKDYPQITFGSFTGETVEEGGENLRKKLTEKYGMEIPPNEIVSRDEIRKNPPNLLFTNYSMLEYLLIRPNDFNIFLDENIKKWQFVILDEAHTYTGALGIEISVLLRRVTGIANRKPQFILTSATLGDEKKDLNAIIDFAESLTTSKFNKEDIIFAKRIPLNNMDIKYSIDPKIYSEIMNNYNDLEKIKKLVNKYDNFSKYNNVKELIFDLLIQDKNLYLISKELKSDRIKTFSEVLENLRKYINILEQELVDFIQLISKANKNDRTLFDSKYHTFVRTLDGAFVTIGNNKKMKLTNHKDIDGMRAFEIGLCKYCNQMYLIGKEFNGFLYQNSDIDIDENYGDIENTNVNYYLLKEKAIIDEKLEDQVEECILCSKCGKIYLKNNINAEKCDCGQEFLIEVYKVCNEKSEVKNNLTTCPCCTRNTTNGSGIVSGFHLNKDSATALLSQILYETISENKNEKNNKKNEISINFFGNTNPSNTIYNENNEKKEKNGKQLIAFSDSRQQASFFATFFEYIHNRFLRKRLLWEELLKNNHESIKLEKLPAKLEKEISDKKLFDTNYTASMDAWICIMNELLNIDGNYTAEAIGIFAFELDDNIINDILKQITNLNDILNAFSLTKDEFITIIKVLFNIFRNSSALLYTESDLDPNTKKEEFGYRRFDNYVVFKKEGKTSQNVAGDNRHSFVPVGNGKRENQAYNYVKRVLGKDSNEEIINFLNGIFDIGKNGIFTEKDGDRGEKLYQIDAKKYVLKSYKNLQYYYCPICEKVTQYNVKNVCPTKFCSGKLEPIDPDEMFKNNYYRKEYMNKKIERIVVKEHTAQLNKDTGRKYQKDFKEKNINVLSCSTTFEMGIDIGKLENVFLRNVPPTPANYAQRAGRAGRRNDSSAFVLTFCGSNSHDYTYFDDPSKMIAGHIMPPKLKITNEKIILRHIMASCLGFFFRNNPEYFENVEMLVCNGGIEAFKAYLGSKPKELEKYINEKILDDNIRKEYDNFKWIDKLLNEDSELEHFYASTLNRINELTEAEIQSSLNRDYIKSQYFSKEVDKIKSSRVINTLSSNCVIPKYGFPVDVVELNIYENGKLNDKYNLSRDLSIAISEYAPDSEIIVDDKKYTSRYILKPKSQNQFSMFFYYKCKNCERINVQESMTNKIESCQYCHTPYNDIIQYYIEPIYGFATDQKNKESRTKRPRKTYSGDYEYLGEGVSNNDKISYKNFVTIESAKDDKLLVLNSNPFFKCNICGYTVLNKSKAELNTITKSHNNYLGYPCDNNQLSKVALGHTFKTDVIKIGILGLTDKRKALSTLYAIIEGISDAFDIERKDINGITNKKENGEYELIIFDNVPGGAGHVKRILESNNLKIAFLSAYKKVNMQCCDEDTSCYNCLRNFNNQRVHKDLKRKYAKEILKSVINCIDAEVSDYEMLYINDCIDFNRSYSLEGYISWNEIEMFFDNINIKDFENNNIRIPDYADSYLKLPNKKSIHTGMLWEKENVAIVYNEDDYNELIKYGIKVFKINDIKVNFLAKNFK